MTIREQIIAGLLIQVARRKTTVERIREQLAADRATVAAAGVDADRHLVERIGIVEETLLRIDESRARILRRSGN